MTERFQGMKGNVAKLLVAGVAGSFALTGCGGGEHTAADTPADPMAASMNAYRNDIFFNRKAEIAMDACAGWENESGGITVVENPGVATADAPGVRGQNYAYFVWSFPDTDGKPPLIQQMDGPETYVDPQGRVFGGGPSGSILTINLERAKSGFANATQRALKKRPVTGHNGQVYYEDAKTGQPVMNTVLTHGPLTSQRVNDVCRELAHDQKVKAAQ